MSKNGEIEMTADSHIPSDLLTPSLGSNYGLDGYPDMEYGMGNLERVIGQEYNDLPALPDGVREGSSSYLDMSFMYEEPLANLDWLDPSQIQDPIRLPETPESIPELEEAWGVHSRPETTHLVDVSYLRANSDEEPAEDPESKKARSRAIERIVTHSMRKSIEGADIGSIIREANIMAGMEAGKLSTMLSMVEAEHGLAGNVFVRSSAYPGWGTGKWKDHVKAHAKDARYILVSGKDIKSASWIIDGRCSYTGKKAVVEVPWKEALSYYKPRLEATGRRVASGDPRESLRSAFLSTPKKARADTGHLPVHKTPDRDVSRAAARRELNSYKPETRVLDRSASELNRLLTKAASYISRMETNHLVPPGTKDSMVSSGLDPASMVREAVKIAKKVKGGTYTGDDKSLVATSDFHNKNLDRMATRESDRADLEERRNKSRREAKVARIVASIESEINKGVRGSNLHSMMKRVIPAGYSKEVVRALEPILAKTGATREKDSRVYEGDDRAVAATSEFSSRSVVSRLAESPKQAIQAVKWVRKAMTEGAAGSDLDQMIEGRIAGSVMKSSGSSIKAARKAHEGLSGFLYVDAEVYASENGAKGCESGGLRHRANTIPYVLSMPRCSTCVLSRKMEDGSKKCGEYNKILLKPSELSGPEVEGIRAENLRACEMDDAEQTANLFAPSYDPNEFSLSNDVLEGIEFESPENEKVMEVTFGDWKIW